MTERLHPAFTLVFHGDIRAFKGNPLRAETPFGAPRAMSNDDAFARYDELEEQHHALLSRMEVLEGALEKCLATITILMAAGDHQSDAVVDVMREARAALRGGT